MINAFQSINENITLVRGDTLAFGVELYEIDEERDDLVTLLTEPVDTFYFSVRKDYANTENVFQKSLADGIQMVEPGKYRVRVAPEDTLNLEIGNYYYDCEIGINGDSFTILRGLFAIAYDISKIVIPGYNSQLAGIVNGSITKIEKSELEGITQVRPYAFYTCDLESVVVPDGVTTVGQNAFGNCSQLVSVVLPAGLTSIGPYAFADCSSLETVNIPASVTTIGRDAFYRCTSLTSVVIPVGVTTISAYMCEQCHNLQSVTIPEGVTSINTQAFISCRSLQSLTLPESLTEIGNFAFSGCSSLTHPLHIPENVTSIGSNAFSGCTGITEVYVHATTPPTLGSSAFRDVTLEHIYVPADSVAAYQAASNWSTYASIISAIGG